MTEVYDLSVPISDRLTAWPGDPEVAIGSAESISGGADYNVSTLRLGSHTGTHVDAPRHVQTDGTSVDQLPLDALVGDAWVCRLPPSAMVVTAALLAEARIPPGTRRILIATSNSRLWGTPDGPFEEEFVALAPDAAEWLARRGLRLVGIDYLSIGRGEDGGLAVHRTLLERGVVVVEGLDLRTIPGGPCKVYCLPLKIVGGDGAPARVIATRE